MNDELEEIWKGTLLIKSRCYFGVIVEGLRKPQKMLKTTGVRSEISNQYLPNAYQRVSGKPAARFMFIDVASLVIYEI
jgi:hypothetical protein